MNEMDQDTIKTKVLIIGAGPAGLCAGYSYKKYDEDFIIVDLGKDINCRDRQNEYDCVSGIGGSGLFSDGKFSFFPSGTKLWDLENKKLLLKAYDDLKMLFNNSINFSLPDFPSNANIFETNQSNDYELKLYPSYYISLDDRIKLMEEIIKDFKDKIFLGWKVIDWKKSGSYYIVEVEHQGLKTIIICQKILLAGGRFQPLFLKNVPMIFRRYEFGIRLVGRNSLFSEIRVNNTIDPKWIFKPTNNSEFRTFCMCKDGEYVQSNFLGYKSFSGRADIPPSGITNFGLTLRLKEQTYSDFEKILSCQPFEYKIVELIENQEILSDKFGKELSELYNEGLNKFLSNFKLNTSEITVVGPSIEGVGSYPNINNSLKIENEEIYVAGDCTGIFRGIVPSMLSGSYIGNLISSNTLSN